MPLSALAFLKLQVSGWLLQNGEASMILPIATTADGRFTPVAPHRKPGRPLDLSGPLGELRRAVVRRIHRLEKRQTKIDRELRRWRGSPPLSGVEHSVVPPARVRSGGQGGKRTMEQFETESIAELVLDEARVAHADVRAFGNAVLHRLPDDTPIAAFIEALFKSIWRLTRKGQQEDGEWPARSANARSRHQRPPRRARRGSPLRPADERHHQR